jgi:hypothetical protein
MLMPLLTRVASRDQPSKILAARSCRFDTKESIPPFALLRLSRTSKLAEETTSGFQISSLSAFSRGEDA